MIRNLVALDVYGTDSRRLIHVGTEGGSADFGFSLEHVL
jgi:hypothetical protein